jgi:hypothetical protein
MKNKIKNTVLKNLINIPGYRTNRKIIVFESDDWGMIRMSSSTVKESLKEKGYRISQCPYNSNDRIENDEDIESLAETLLSVKDSKGNPAKFTLNNIVANPDFKKIKADSFKNYHFQPFTETLQEYNDSQNVIALYKEGINNKVFQPQLHGREHINLRLWLNRLQIEDVDTIEAFNQNMYTVHHSGPIGGRRNNLDAFGNMEISGDNFNYPQIIKEAQQIFHNTWGFKSKSFIAPCYVWHPSLEKILSNEGINYIQGSRVQKIPVDNTSFQIKKKYHYTGQKNKYGQHYLVRNCNFEPTELGRNNAIENALKDIRVSFFYNKPAIISTHRLNYIGSINSDNRKKNLNLLKILINQIIKIWPDAEFMSSDELGDIITNKCAE